MDRPKTPAQENRLKILSIDQNFMVDVLNWWRRPPTWLALPVTEQLPEDTEVVGMTVHFERRCLDALVASKEFEIVPPGYLPPRIPDIMREPRLVPFKEDDL